MALADYPHRNGDGILRRVPPGHMGGLAGPDRPQRGVGAKRGPGKFSYPEEMKTVQETILEVVKSRSVLAAALREVGPPAGNSTLRPGPPSAMSRSSARPSSSPRRRERSSARPRCSTWTCGRKIRSARSR